MMSIFEETEPQCLSDLVVLVNFLACHKGSLSLNFMASLILLKRRE